MAATIKVKRETGGAGDTPTTSDIEAYEIAQNVTDKRLFGRDGSNNIFEFGINPTSITTGADNGSFITVVGFENMQAYGKMDDMWNAPNSKMDEMMASNLSKSEGIETYSMNTLVGNIEGNLTGNVTGNVSGSSGSTTGNAATATTAAALTTGRTIGMTGDVVWTSASFDGSGNVTGTATIQAGVVSSTELASAVTLLIKDSGGTTVKTIIGAGS